MHWPSVAALSRGGASATSFGVAKNAAAVDAPATLRKRRREVLGISVLDVSIGRHWLLRIDPTFSGIVIPTRSRADRLSVAVELPRGHHVLLLGIGYIADSHKDTAYWMEHAA